MFTPQRTARRGNLYLGQLAPTDDEGFSQGDGKCSSQHLPVRPLRGSTDLVTGTDEILWEDETTRARESGPSFQVDSRTAVCDLNDGRVQTKGWRRLCWKGSRQ